MPNRIIKESINESRGLSECSVFADDLYKRLITYADDYGRFNSDTMIMRARLYPREYEFVTEGDILDGLVELVGAEKIAFYTAKSHGHNGIGVYGVFPNWREHQRVRDTKAKCPEPENTDINDWYLRRFVPMDMKVAIVERDNFKCCECGKYLTSCHDAKRFVKLGQGLYNIDHIVPVLQGGRATLENLRLTCPECNLKRKKTFTFQEILNFTLSQQSENSCGNLRRTAAASCFNPIQSESNPNPNPNPESESNSTRTREAADPGLAKVMTLYMDRVQSMPSPSCIESLKGYTAELSADVVCHAIERALDDNKRSWSYIQGILRRYSAEGLTSLEAVQASEAEFERAKEQNAQATPKPTAQRKSFSELIAERTGTK